jgi:CubicO group peptidase (beta-lactamase class C family)
MIPSTARAVFRLASIYLLTGGAVFAQPPATRLTRDTEAAIDAVVRRERDRQQAPAISVAIGFDGAVRYAKAFGFADLELQVPATTNTRFKTASLAKPLTATAVMHLTDTGLMNLDAPIQTYCPAFPEKAFPVTARQLLGHVAGVRHYVRPSESSSTTHFFTIADSLRPFKNDPLLFEPGSRYEYSTYGYVVLGCAIEGASRTDFGRYLADHITGPLNMSRTVLDDIYQIVPDRARGYQRLDESTYRSLPPSVQAWAVPGGIYNAVLNDTSMKLPAGGLLSTPADLVRFGLALLDGRPVKASTVSQMWTRQKTRDGSETPYGLGFGVQTANGAQTVSHSGNQAGAAALLRILPARGVVLVIMTNLETVDTAAIAHAILTALDM